MLQRVRIRGYRMLRDVDVPLKPLTVLIGANDTGKSTFMRALQWIGRDLPWSGDLSWHRRRAPIAIDFEGQWEGRAGAFTKSSVPDTGNRITASRGDAAVLATARAAAQSAVIVELPREGPVMRGSAIADSQGAPSVDPSGSTSPGLLDHYLRKDRARFDRFVKEARELIPGLDDLAIDALDASTRELKCRIEDGFEISANAKSSGDRILLFFLLTVLHPTPPSLFMLEEPETGLHPSRLGKIVELLRSLTRGERGAPPVQVVLSTHSPYLLDFVDLQTDQVLVFRRGADGEAKVDAVDPKRLEKSLKVFNLGEIWLNEDEAGLVGESAPTEPGQTT